MKDPTSKNRVDVDRFAGVTDPTEILRIMHNHPPYDPQKNYLAYSRPLSAVYKSLDAADLERMVEVATAELDADADSDAGSDMATCLACFTEADLTPVQEALLGGW